MTEEETWKIHIVKLEGDEKPYPATAHLSGRETVTIDIDTATEEQLRQARIDLNNSSIKQDFDDNKDVSAIRGGLHAAILNRLQKLTLSH